MDTTNHSNHHSNDDEEGTATMTTPQIHIRISRTHKPSLEQCLQFVSSSSNTSNTSNNNMVSSPLLPSCGAISTFLGVTREDTVDTVINNNDEMKKQKSVLTLFYEGYIPMALQMLYKICCQAVLPVDTSNNNVNNNNININNDNDNDNHENSYKVCKIAIHHILGDCPVGHTSVIVAVSSPHRYNAIHCIEHVMTQLKSSVPIWKKEIYCAEQVNDDDDGCHCSNYNNSSSVWKENKEWHDQKLKQQQQQQL